MSAGAVAARSAHKGSESRLLSPEERTLLAGNILFEDLLRHDTSTGAIRNMADEISGVELSLTNSFLSKYLVSEHLSLRSAVGAHPSERLSSKREELLNFIHYVRNVTDGIPADRVINLDPTSVYSDSRYIRQAGAKGRYRLMVLKFSSSAYIFLIVRDLDDLSKPAVSPIRTTPP